jgi:hypothetical protein
MQQSQIYRTAKTVGTCCCPAVNRASREKGMVLVVVSGYE